MKLKQAPTAPDLSNDVISILLAGWSAEPPNSFERTRGFGGGMTHFMTGGLGAHGLWARYEDFLRGMARQWGWAPPIVGPDGRRYFYGEFHAAGFADHEGTYLDSDVEDDG